MSRGGEARQPGGTAVAKAAHRRRQTDVATRHEQDDDGSDEARPGPVHAELGGAQQQRQQEEVALVRGEGRGELGDEPAAAWPQRAQPGDRPGDDDAHLGQVHGDDRADGRAHAPGRQQPGQVRDTRREDRDGHGGLHQEERGVAGEGVVGSADAERRATAVVLREQAGQPRREGEEAACAHPGQDQDEARDPEHGRGGDADQHRSGEALPQLGTRRVRLADDGHGFADERAARAEDGQPDEERDAEGAQCLGAARPGDDDAEQEVRRRRQDLVGEREGGSSRATQRCMPARRGGGRSRPDRGQRPTLSGRASPTAPTGACALVAAS